MVEALAPGRPGRRAGAVPLAAVLLAAACVLLSACSAPGTAPSARGSGGFDLGQLVKTDINRVAETHQQHVFASLRRLADKLYRRNPAEWRKGGAPSAEAAVSRIFDEKHRWRFASLGHRRDLEAMRCIRNFAAIACRR